MLVFVYSSEVVSSASYHNSQSQSQFQTENTPLLCTVSFQPLLMLMSHQPVWIVLVCLPLPAGGRARAETGNEQILYNAMKSFSKLIIHCNHQILLLILYSYSHLE